MKCGSCAADLGRIERVGRRDTCPRCGADLHTCRQCRFYDPRVYNECREPQAERVLDKARSNFCDYFAAAEAAPAGAPRPRASGAPPALAPDAPRSPAPGGGARDALERLFRRR